MSNWGFGDQTVSEGGGKRLGAPGRWPFRVDAVDPAPNGKKANIMRITVFQNGEEFPADQWIGERNVWMAVRIGEKGGLDLPPGSQLPPPSTWIGLTGEADFVHEEYNGYTNLKFDFGGGKKKAAPARKPAPGLGNDNVPF